MQPHQDWNTVTLRGGRLNATAPKAIQARPTGLSEAAHARKLDESDMPIKPKYITSESKQELIRARLAQSLTQDKADARCALPKHTFRDLEAGKLTPSPAILRAISRELGVNLKLE